MSKKYDVFISYRREGGLKDAMLLKNALEGRGYLVFFDMFSLDAGEFDQQLYARIDECEDFLLILPPKALDRCEDEEDWVRRETEYAYAKDKNIIPIMLDGFSFPEELPESFEFISLMHGLTLSDEYYDAFIDKLTKYLRSKPEQRKKEEKRKTRRIVIIAGLAAVVLIAAALLWKPVPPGPDGSEKSTAESQPLENTAPQDDQTAVPELPTPEPSMPTPPPTVYEPLLERFVGDIGDYEQKPFAGAAESSAKDAASGASAAADGDEKTAWIEGAADNGTGEYMVLRFDDKTRVDLIGICSGSNSAVDTLRPKVLEIRFTDREPVWCSLPNENRTLLFTLDEPVYTKSVTLIIKEVWPGTDGEDTAVAEVTAYALRRPSAADIKNPGEKFQFPAEGDYLEIYREAVVKAPQGYSVYCYRGPRRDGGTYDQILDGERVTVLAESGGLSCVIVQSDNKAAWVGTEHLVYDDE